MMKHKNFVAFILTHGRPEGLHTLRSLKRAGYTGPIKVIIDNEDEKAEEYKKKYGDMVYQFDKLAISKTFDEGDNFNDRRAIVYARNACFEIAKKFGYDYFIQLDDDYTCFSYRADGQLNYIEKTNIRHLDEIFDSMINFLCCSKAHSVAMLQGGDFIGGKNSSNAKEFKLLRKCMNTFFCRTDKPFTFSGRINEDVNTYTESARRGFLFFSVPNLGIKQKQTQSNKGGMTDIYKASGTYIKSFYTVMFCPSCAKIKQMGAVHRRIHHSINWNNAVPLILREYHRKV